MNSTERAESLRYLEINHNLRTSEMDEAGMPEGWVVDGKFLSRHPDIVERLRTPIIPFMPKVSIFGPYAPGVLMARVSVLDMNHKHGPGVGALIQRDDNKWTPFYLLTEDLIHGDPAILLEEARTAWNTEPHEGRSVKEGAYIALTGQDPGEEYLRSEIQQSVPA